MANQNHKSVLYPRIADFYNGKSVLITGAAGFVGMIILEILLRNCPGIKAIYILIRQKKGVKPEERKEKLFKETIFNQLKEEQPDALGKVHVVEGDVSQPDLGMCEEDLQKVIQEVSIVFHAAAEINFLKPMKHIISTNCNGTHHVVELCKKCKNLEILVYTSTIFSNCNRTGEIHEDIYRLPFKSQKFLDELKNGTDESLEKLVSECYPTWPNAYTFSKCLSENILLENESEVPFAIIRPSLVITVWKAPQPGFIVDNSAFMLFNFGVGKGFIKVVTQDEEYQMDGVPVDIVANAHIVAAWKVATARAPSPFVVNCTAYGSTDYSWKAYSKALVDYVKVHPIPNTFRTLTGFKMVKSKLVFRILCFYEHYVPAYVMDFFLKVSGKKPRLIPLYQLLDKAMTATYHFTTNKWAYTTIHFRGLEDHLDEEDRKTFYTDFKEYSLEKYMTNLPIGCPQFDWALDKKSVNERMAKAYQRYLITVFVKYSFLVAMCVALYYIISMAGRMTGVF